MAIEQEKFDAAVRKQKLKSAWSKEINMNADEAVRYQAEKLSKKPDRAQQLASYKYDTIRDIFMNQPGLRLDPELYRQFHRYWNHEEYLQIIYF